MSENDWFSTREYKQRQNRPKLQTRYRGVLRNGDKICMLQDYRHAWKTVLQEGEQFTNHVVPAGTTCEIVEAHLCYPTAQTLDGTFAFRIRPWKQGEVWELLPK